MADKGIPKNRWNVEGGSSPLGGPDRAGCSSVPEIQPMISGRDNKSVKYTKVETSNQKWPNLQYKSYSKYCLDKLCSFV
jgi:hypothetical protein